MKSTVLLALGAFVCLAGEWKTTVPFTYNIEYGSDHVGSERYLKTIGEAPPDFLHVGEDIPFSSTFGTKRDYAGVKADLFKLLTVEEVRAKIAELQNYTASLHKAGVKWVIPYICNELAFGDHVRRAGVLRVLRSLGPLRRIRLSRQTRCGYPACPEALSVRGASAQSRRRRLPTVQGVLDVHQQS